MNWRNFIFLCLFNQIISDKYQVVHRGPCLNKQNSFCHSKVKNSYCSKQNNECFCLSDFVTVRERSGVKCKPLLSEMKCRVDGECSEIANSSICHPGAGSCTCPSGTVYVPHQNFCKNYLGNSTNDVCYHCSRLGGTCFSEETLKSPFQKHFMYNTSCVCPFNTITPNTLSTMIRSKEHFMSNICSAIQVNLGEYCNDVDILCISRNSRCLYSQEYMSTICQCRNGHVAVFEKKFGHFNCYKSVFEMDYPQCAHCFTSGGNCILIAKSSSNVLLKCLCNKYQYFDIFSHTFECLKVSASIKCQSLKIEVCLNIPINYEFHKQLFEYIRRTPNSISISDAYPGKKNSSYKVCKMNDYKISYEKVIATLCSQFETNSRSLDNCGISSGNYLDINFFGLYMRVWSQPYIINLADDFLFDLTCKTNIEQEEYINGQILDRSWSGTGRAALPDVFVDLDDIIDLTISNTEKSQKEFISYQSIQIHCKFYKRREEFAHFTVEQCSEIIDNTPKVIYRRLFLRNENFSQKIQFHQQIINSSENHREKQIKLISTEFAVPNVSTLTNVVYSCIVKLCEDSFWCSQVENSETDEPFEFRKPIKHVNVRFIIKQIHIQVISSQVDQKFVTFKTESNFCQIGSICLSQNQLIILSILTGIFFILVFVVLTILMLKRSMAQLSNSENDNSLHQMNFMDISLIPLMDIYRNGDESLPTLKQTELFSSIPSGDSCQDSHSSNIIQNSLYLPDVGQISINESNIQFYPFQNHSLTTELTDNKFLSTFHLQQSHVSIDNSPEALVDNPLITKSQTQSRAQNISFLKLNDQIPLLCNSCEPGLLMKNSQPLQSTLTCTTK